MKFKEIADAFRELAVIVNKPNSDVPVKLFSHACSRFFLIFTVLKPAFKFAENDYVSKVNDLAKASPSTLTLEAMVDRDIEAKRVRKVGSHTRNLLRVKRGLEMIRVLCEETLATEADSPLKDAAYKAYNQVFGPHHGWAIQLAASTGFGSLLLMQRESLFSEEEENHEIYREIYGGPIYDIYEEDVIDIDLGFLEDAFEILISANYGRNQNSAKSGRISTCAKFVFFAEVMESPICANFVQYPTCAKFVQEDIRANFVQHTSRAKFEESLFEDGYIEIYGDPIYDIYEDDDVLLIDHVDFMFSDGAFEKICAEFGQDTLRAKSGRSQICAKFGSCKNREKSRDEDKDGSAKISNAENPAEDSRSNLSWPARADAAQLQDTRTNLFLAGET
ncbi:unnamed protein product [Arabidopsis lyrata]|nr:unnamed protein product [Arabidopsis lyrata]